MFEFLRGALVQSFPNKVILDVHGVGYGIHISLKTFQRLPKIGSELLLHVVSVIREESHSLFGFFTLQENYIFKQLIAINGIGPKVALIILGHVEVEDLQLAILQNNLFFLSKIPGVGKKRAERLVIELKDRLIEPVNKELASLNSGVLRDALSALTNLGYQTLEAQRAIQKAVASEDKEFSLSELISKALKSI